MASPRTRSEVWQGYIDAERLGRYYFRLAERYESKSKWIQFALAFAALGGLARLVGLFPENWAWLGDLGTSAVIAFVIFNLMAGYSRKAAVLHAISLRCADLERQWRALWNTVDVEGVDEWEIMQRTHELEATLLEITTASTHAGVKQDPKLNERAAEEAYRVIVDRYATETPANG